MKAGAGIAYEDCVIGGPGAFIITIKDREKFQEAIRTKLVIEVAGLTPESGIVQSLRKSPRVSCLIGEKKSQTQAAMSVETIIQSRRTNKLSTAFSMVAASAQAPGH